MKILISGGHLTPALATIDYLQAEHPDTQIVFVGRNFSQDKLGQVSQEAAEIKQRNLPFIVLQAPRMSRDSILNLLLGLPTLIIAITQSVSLLVKHKPDVFLTFGGYLALPVAVSCWLLRIPIVTHEQTRAAGLANQLISHLARYVAISYTSSRKYFSPDKVVLTGNPLRPSLFVDQPRPEWLTVTPNRPILYITGGNQGSEILNTVTQQALRPLLSQWFVIHQCGNPTQRRNYKSQMQTAVQQLPLSFRQHYIVKEWISDHELGWIYQHASVVISRAGANTVAELIAHRLPAILIPLPFAHQDEQTLNAQYMVELGGAEIIVQKDLNSVSLLKKIGVVKKAHATMVRHLTSAPTQTNVTAKLYEVLLDAAK